MVRNMKLFPAKHESPADTSPDHRVGEPALRAGMSLAQRALLFVACCATGTVIGVIGHSYTMQSEWFLAIPICIAIGWLFVADPNECVACDSAPNKKHKLPG